MSEMLIDIITNVFVMFGVMWFIDSWWCDVMCREIDFGIEMIISFLVMTVLFFGRVR